MTTSDQRPHSLAVLTSGGDAPGMNAAVRAVVRTSLYHGMPVHAVHEGYRGLIAGGDMITELSFGDVGGILQRGGTVIGSARSEEFRTREGRRLAAKHLAERGVDALVVIGGDGSLTGAAQFRREWPELLAELVAAGELPDDVPRRLPMLRLAGLIGSIDNDMYGTDMTIGTDSALHRITEAMDAIHSTAASHQRSFVVEVMGRRCGYLALMSALAAGANWVLIPEHPPVAGEWEQQMCAALRAGRAAGRRQNIVVLAEGAHDTAGTRITSERVKQVLSEELHEDTRVTILGHVQRGGAPSAFDRHLGTVCGAAAVEHLLRAAPDAEPVVVGMRQHKVVTTPLEHAVAETQKVSQMIAEGRYEEAMALRGSAFVEAWRTHQTMTQATPKAPAPGQRPLRIAILHAGGPAPGMNTAVRAAVRMGMDRGHQMLAVRNGFRGLIGGAVHELDWMSVNGWVARGGAEFGASRHVPTEEQWAAVAQTLTTHEVDGLLMIGGWAGYRGALELTRRRGRHPGLDVPVVCLPASINNDLPGSELSIGADSALNSIVADVDKIKQSAVASHRCFVVEVMGHDCGYLPLMAGLATGAEHVFLPEEGITLEAVSAAVTEMVAGFNAGKRLGLVIRGELADPNYTTDVLRAIFEKEGGDLFDVRQAVLGHVQQGGSPSPFDRIQATKLAGMCIDYLSEHRGEGGGASAFLGLVPGRLGFTPLERMPEMVEQGAQRPLEQRWLALRPLADMLSAAGPAAAPSPDEG